MINPRSHLVSVTLAAAIGICIQSPVMAQASARNEVSIQTFDIKAQSLSAALRAYADQTGEQVVFFSEVGKGLESAEVIGKFTREQALKKLLEKTGLTFKRLNSKTIAISDGKHEANVSEAALRLAYTEDSVDEAAQVISADGKREVKSRQAGEGGVEEMIVEEGRIKPFSNASMDIPRTNSDVQPYYIFDSETIERSAALNVEDFLKQRLTMNATVRTNGQQALNPSSFGNTSAINLRGLGTDKTLVLLNGRRLAAPDWSSSGLGGLNAQQVDLNGIPLSSIERIEVLPSSASGIYGGSAMGGVINVILKRDFNGGEVRATYDNTWNTDSPSRTAGISYGFGLNAGKTHVMASAQWGDAQSLVLQDRRESVDRGLENILRNSPGFLYSGTTPILGSLPNITSASSYNPVTRITTPDPGRLAFKDGTLLGSRNTHLSAGTSPNTSAAAIRADLLANVGTWNLELPSTMQSPTGLLRPFSVTPTTSAFSVSVDHALGSKITIRADWAKRENNSLTNFLPPVARSITFRLPIESPFNPFDSGISVVVPYDLSFPRRVFSFTENASFGMTAKLPHSWTGLFDYTWSRNRTASLYSVFDDVPYNIDLSSGALNPLVDTLLYPLNLQKYSYSPLYDFYSGMRSFAMRGSGPLFGLPWGTPTLTIGLEHRIAYTPENSLDVDFPLSGSRSYNTTYFERQQDSSSAYAEMLVPLVRTDVYPMLRSLELQLAGRGERYAVDTGTPYVTVLSQSGVVTYNSPTNNGQPFFSRSAYTSKNNTVGLKYEPVSGMILRASIATAFLPPGPNQLLKNPLLDTSDTMIADPKRNIGYRVATISGGNPDLKPQNSKSFNAGLIWQPGWDSLKGLRFNAEYYRIEQFDAISSLGAQELINNESAYPGRVIRDASGAITLVDMSLLNLYKRDTQGWDLSVDYRVKTALGGFDVRAAHSTILSLENQYLLTAPSTDAVNFPSEGGAGKYKSNLLFTWDLRNIAASWAISYFGAYKQNGAVGGPDATRRRQTNPNAALSTTYTAAQGGDTIPSQMYHDLVLGYSFGKERSTGNRLAAFGAEALSGLTLQLGIKNVFNKLPPYDVYYDYYLSPYGDMRLRSYWLNVKKSF